jgi:hypothetical protein
VGTYVGEVTASFAGDSNFTASSGSADLMITPAPLTITANNQTKVYGAAVPALTASYTGFVNGDTSASLTTLPTLTTRATAGSHVAGSPYAISASGAVDPNYTISYVAGSLTVTTAPLTITVNNQAKVYGAALPTLTASYTGFVNGDTAASLTTAPTVTTTATAASTVAGSPYAVSASGAVDSDYAISYVAGSLTVTPAPLTITANDQAKVYGAALPPLTVSYTGFVNGDTSASLATLPSCSTTAMPSSPVGTYPLTCSGATSADYTISYVAGALTIIPAPQAITFTPNPLPDRTLGDQPFTVAATASGGLTVSFVAGPSGVCTASGASGSTITLVGVGTCTVTASQGGDANYQPAAPVARLFAVRQASVGLTVTTTGPGAVNPGTGTYPPGPLTLTAVPNSGALFTGWRVDGVVVGWNPTLTLTVSGPRPVDARFAARPAFTDVAPSGVAWDAITQLAARGIIKGYGDGRFGPGAPVLRAQMAALIVRALGWDGSTPGGPAPFADLGGVDAELQRAIAILAQRGIINGYGDGTFGPGDEVRHVQVISFVTRSMVQAGYWQAVTQDNPALYPNVPLSSGHRLDLLTFAKNAGAIPDRPASAAWADWDTIASRGWTAQIVWQALNSYFGIDRVP